MGLISGLFEIYICIIIIDTIISYIPNLKDNEVSKALKGLTEPVLSKIRGFLPQDLPFDFSPLIAIVAIYAMKILW